MQTEDGQTAGKPGQGPTSVDGQPVAPGADAVQTGGSPGRETTTAPTAEELERRRFEALLDDPRAMLAEQERRRQLEADREPASLPAIPLVASVLISAVTYVGSFALSRVAEEELVQVTIASLTPVLLVVVWMICGALIARSSKSPMPHAAICGVVVGVALLVLRESLGLQQGGESDLVRSAVVMIAGALMFVCLGAFSVVYDRTRR